MFANPFQGVGSYGFGFPPSPMVYHPGGYYVQYGQGPIGHNQHFSPHYQAPSPYVQHGNQHPSAGQMGYGYVHGYGYGYNGPPHGQMAPKPQLAPTEKSKPKQYETKKQPHHLQHGYPYGQGSGMFPDYYNTTY